MSKYENYDFCGWATRNDVLCSDGRTIRKGAFDADNGKKVPLIWGHQHDSPEAVLGHGYLETRPEGVYVYGYLNDSPMGQAAKHDVDHGDITSLSIWANHLKQNGGDVIRGCIKEVSLVLSGANEKACIEYPILAHGDDTEEDMSLAYIYMGEECAICHSDSDSGEDFTDEALSHGSILDRLRKRAGPGLEHAEKTEDDPNKGEIKMDEKEKKQEPEKEPEPENGDKTLREILDTLNDDQKAAVGVVIGNLINKNKNNSNDSEEKLEHSDDSEGGNTMQYNAFDSQATENEAGFYLSHSDEMGIISAAKELGSLKKAMRAYEDEHELQHDDLQPVSGFTSYPSGATPAGVDALFPEWHDVRPGAPEIVTNDQAWVKAVLGKVHRSPFSRIRTSQVDLRTLEAMRAKGYQKGTEKALLGNYQVAKRTTEPQTVYVKSALNRDDVVDITDFDYVDYQFKIDRMLLEKELAQAILIGDGRDVSADDKIFADHIRPIYGDSDVFTVYRTVDATADANDPGFGTNYLYAQAVEEAILDAKIDYRGSGNMDMFCEQRFFNKIQMAKDLNGRRLYSNKSELTSALDVNGVYNVPEFANLTRTVGEGTSARTYKLLAIIVNLGDYSIGATKGGEITHFTDFDIDFNQLKSLLETRTSGANTRICSAIVLEEEVSNP